MAVEKALSLQAEIVRETPSRATDPLTAQQARSCSAVLSSGGGVSEGEGGGGEKKKSSPISFSRSMRFATLTQASTCPATRCPSSGSPRRRELSKFTILPTDHWERVVCWRVVVPACTRKRNLPC